MTDPVAILKTVLPYVLGLAVFFALALDTNVSPDAKAAGTLLIGAAIALIDPSRKPPSP